MKLSCVFYFLLTTFFAIQVLANDEVPSSTPAEKSILNENSAGLNADVMERVRDFAQKELWLSVTSTNATLPVDDTSKLADSIEKIKGPSHVACIALVMLKEKTSSLLETNTTKMIAWVNVQNAKTDDAEMYYIRLARLTMRSAGFLFGLTSAPDPHCVSHWAKNIDELDKIGMNFCPPWTDRLRKTAESKGMTVLKPLLVRPTAKPPAKPN